MKSMPSIGLVFGLEQETTWVTPSEGTWVTVLGSEKVS